ncbi:MAG: hypothetical protein NTX61_13150 [Bacteroidetes bacterium]|nr:hypothetical protein [Bacteroidota bacterium]
MRTTFHQSRPCIYATMITLLLFCNFGFAIAGSIDWPKQIITDKATILIYQFQPESFAGNILSSRAAVSITKAGETQPVFGAIWTEARVNTDRESRMVTLMEIKIKDVKFPSAIPAEKIEKFKALLEEEIPKWDLEFSLDELLSSLKVNEAAVKVSENMNNDPPDIIYSKLSSILLIFDGDPKFVQIPKSDLKKAVNTPFFLVQDTKSGNFYLFGGNFWYATMDLLNGNWTSVDPPKAVKKIQEELNAEADKQSNPNEEKNETDAKPVAQIYVKTTSSELIQSDGEPNFAPIQGTNLLYMTNSDNEIFMNIDKQQYYVLLSGRWYISPAISGPWTFLPADKLPSDFANIPEGNEKDIVLASVPGTDAAQEAILDAQLPQTAAVDRKSANTSVQYDGDPKFEQIKGTNIYRGINTNSTVLLYQKVYYVCDNAVWFTSIGPEGPWIVATTLPDEIQKIPPDDPAYNVKYVYIYDVQPEIVYMGYTPGYMGCYIYGPTVVYGTGWRYHSWYGNFYYPRPYTWGFSMHYNPWTGWSMGYNMTTGFFNWGYGPHYHGGWWGPPHYRPPYFVPFNHYYGPRPLMIKHTNIPINNYYRNNSQTRNIYNNVGKGVRPYSRQQVQEPSTRQIQKESKPPAGRDKAGTQPGQKTGQTGVRTSPGKAPVPNNVITDKNGDVYRKKGNIYEKNDGKGWKPVDRRNDTKTGAKPADRNNQQTQPAPSVKPDGFNRQELEKQNKNRDRGVQRLNNQNNFQRNMAPAAPKINKQPAPARQEQKKGRK